MYILIPEYAVVNIKYCLWNLYKNFLKSCNLFTLRVVLLVKGLLIITKGALMRLPMQKLFEKYQGNLYAAAFNVCKNAEDAEDVVQDTFIQYYSLKKEFESEEHIRAWLLRVTINKAKNMNRTFWRRNKQSLEDYMETLSFETPESGELFEAAMNLPEKYRIVIHLFYYEDYSIHEIAGILKLSESNVKVRLSRGRSLLKEKLQEEWENDE